MLVKVLSENTKLPLSFVLILLAGAFSTGIFYFKTEANAEATGKLESRQDQYDKDMEDIKVDLRLIKEKLGIHGSR